MPRPGSVFLFCFFFCFFAQKKKTSRIERLIRPCMYSLYSLLDIAGCVLYCTLH